MDECLAGSARWVTFLCCFVFSQRNHRVFDLEADSGQLCAQFSELDMHLGSKLFDVLIEAIALVALFRLAGHHVLELGKDDLKKEFVDLA